MTNDQKIDFLTNNWVSIVQTDTTQKELDSNAIVQAWNKYCNENRYYDDLMYDFDENNFNELFSSQSPFDVARDIFFGNIHSWIDDYLYFNGNGNICSCLAMSDDSPIMADLHRFIEWLATEYIENGNYLYLSIGLPDYDIVPDDEQEV